MIDYHLYRLLAGQADDFDANTVGPRDAYDPHPQVVSNTTQKLDASICLHLPPVVYGYPLQRGVQDWGELSSY